jgi:uncharacterized protein (TIGR00730 family)
VITRATSTTPTSTASISPPPTQHVAAPAEHTPASANHHVTGTPTSTSTTRAPGTNAVAVRDPLVAHGATLKADLKLALSTLSALPPALTFFGGARIKKTDPYYAISQAIGHLLAERAVPPRTGAGPGIMQSVPEGYAQRRAALVAEGATPTLSTALRQVQGLGPTASLDDTRTQGFNIKLPHEQSLNPVIEVAREFQLFPFRKMALYENARGVVTFPGGFGTLDELFEIWTLASSGKLHDPLAVVGVDFWKPILGALHDVAVKQRPLIGADDFDRMFVTDDAKALLKHMLDSKPIVRAFEIPPADLERTLVGEVDKAIHGLHRLRPAVAFLGGENLDASDPTLAVVKAVVAGVAGRGVAVRVGDGGTGSQAVLDAAAAAGADGKHVQQVLWTASTTPAPSSSSSSSAVTETFSERIPHKELLLRSAEAFVVLPSGLKGLDEFATVLCQMQTGKLAKRPLVLVGSDYWKPILEAFKQTMLSPERQLIAAEDMDLVTVVDSAEAASAALTNLR